MAVDGIYKLFFLFSVLGFSSAEGLQVCEDKYVNCPSDQCGGYPLDPFYRNNCMKTCGVCTDVNRALSKPTAQSSTSGSMYSSRAVDGDSSSDYTCTLTNDTSTSDHWWCVDLQQVYDIDSIKIHSSDKAERSLRGFQITIGLFGICDYRTFMSSTRCYTDSRASRQLVYTVTGCDRSARIPLVGRFVFITLPRPPVKDQLEDHDLSLCEVRITTGTKCSSGYFTHNSTTCSPCDTCLENSCDAATGKCLDGCIPGYHGDNCENCSSGRYGSTCQSTCDVTNCHGNCDRETGICSRCNPGFYGANCEQSCSDSCLMRRCSKSDGTCFTESMGGTKTGDKDGGDDGMDRSVVGVIGVISGVVITGLLLLVHCLILKRNRIYKMSTNHHAIAPSLSGTLPPLPSVPKESFRKDFSLRYSELDRERSLSHVESASDGKRPTLTSYTSTYGRQTTLPSPSTLEGLTPNTLPYQTAGSVSRDSQRTSQSLEYHSNDMDGDYDYLKPVIKERRTSL